ncbi:putative rRNA methyltransferase [Aphelenchoides fujianensis]|nr:putative rRNA methyltransferase [Aphelenchoides fujianensis]
MGKKVKIGKQRRDKFYHLAKEAGFRSRAAFKLIQLNKRFEFLQRSRALVDLCAAPGGWLQVAAENMPVSSIRIGLFLLPSSYLSFSLECLGVDLVPIKAIKNCITLQGDITTEKTRQLIKSNLNKWEVDCVLHDGAPNVGQNWSHDAFEQNCLTLSALRLATQILRQGGWFVTKIFRSADYAALIQTFEKLFKHVHVWKPAASRMESAEIFVVCEKYAKPDKVDPDLLNIKKVFLQVENNQPDVNMGKIKKAKALGYDDGDVTLFHELKASDFLASTEHLQLLAKASCIVLDEERFEKSPYTTDEFRECIRDVRVCGGGELRKILTWRKKILEEIKKEKEAEKSAGEPELTAEERQEQEEQRELDEIDELIRNASAAEKAKYKKKKREMLKNKKRLQERKQLGMHHENDQIDALDDELFNLTSIRKALQRRQTSDDEDEESELSDYAEGDETNEEVPKWKRTLMDDADGHFREDIIENADDGRDAIGWKRSRKERTRRRTTRKKGRRGGGEEDGEEESDLDTSAVDSDEEAEEDAAEESAEEVDEPAANGVKGAFSSGHEIDVDVSDDDQLAEQESREKSKRKRRFVSEEEEAEQEAAEEPKRAAKKIKLTPMQLAMGEKLIYSSKTRSELEDWAWNRTASRSTRSERWR